jgi:hypothetical protein
VPTSPTAVAVDIAIALDGLDATIACVPYDPASLPAADAVVVIIVIIIVVSMIG